MRLSAADLPPEAGTVIQMTRFRGVLVLACQNGVYVEHEGKIVHLRPDYSALPVRFAAIRVCFTQ